MHKIDIGIEYYTRTQIEPSLRLEKAWISFVLYLSLLYASALLGSRLKNGGAKIPPPVVILLTPSEAESARNLFWNPVGMRMQSCFSDWKILRKFNRYLWWNPGPVYFNRASISPLFFFVFIQTTASSEVCLMQEDRGDSIIIAFAPNNNELEPHCARPCT